MNHYHHRSITVATLIAASCFALGTAQAQTIPGLPEPGFVMYGSVTNTGGNVPLSGLGVVWRIAGPTGAATNAATFVSVNGQVFYLVRMPFETRSTPGTPSFTPTPGTLELTAASSAYSRSATVNGSNATLQGSASFSFGRVDNGKVERINLPVNLPPETFAQWALRIFGNSGINPNADADGDGANNFAEYKAGTDPLSNQSAFKFIEVLPAQPGGIQVRWSSIAGRAYTLERSSNAQSNYTPVASTIWATGSATAFTDATATGTGPFFYRLRLN